MNEPRNIGGRGLKRRQKSGELDAGLFDGRKRGRGGSCCGNLDPETDFRGKDRRDKTLLTVTGSAWDRTTKTERERVSVCVWLALGPRVRTPSSFTPFRGVGHHQNEMLSGGMLTLSLRFGVFRALFLFIYLRARRGRGCGEQCRNPGLKEGPPTDEDSIFNRNSI